MSESSIRLNITVLVFVTMVVSINFWIMLRILDHWFTDNLFLYVIYDARWLLLRSFTFIANFKFITDGHINFIVIHSWWIWIVIMFSTLFDNFVILLALFSWNVIILNILVGDWLWFFVSIIVTLRSSIRRKLIQIIRIIPLFRAKSSCLRFTLSFNHCIRIPIYWIIHRYWTLCPFILLFKSTSSAKLTIMIS